ncbi:MAG: hypothetical protein ACREPY_04950 [Rhodanobacteraceae bacterium]
MTRGDKSSYTDKQKRKAEHIEQGYEKRGASKGEAEERAWRTVNKQDQGGNKSGSSRAAGKSRGRSGKSGGARSHASSSRAAGK